MDQKTQLSQREDPGQVSRTESDDAPGVTPLQAEIHQMPPITRVVAAAIYRENRLLVCQRPVHKRHGGLWEFPGGKCEPGESDADATSRELAEELNVSTEAVGEEIISFADPGSEFLIAFFHVEIAGEPRPVEHSALVWATPDELMQMALAPSDRQFVQFLLAMK